MKNREIEVKPNNDEFEPRGFDICFVNIANKNVTSTTIQTATQDELFDLVNKAINHLTQEQIAELRKKLFDMSDGANSRRG